MTKEHPGSAAENKGLLAPEDNSLKTRQLDLCLNLLTFKIIYCSHPDVQITTQLGRW